MSASAQTQRASLRLCAPLLLIVTLAASVACGPAPAPEGASPSSTAQPFTFQRTREAVIKLDSATGAVWFTSITGEGEWIAIGEAPDDAGEPNVAGRYAVSTSAAARSPMAPRANTPTTVMLFDQATGRLWLSATRRDASWRPVAEPIEGAP